MQVSEQPLGRTTWVMLGVWGLVAAASALAATVAPYLLINAPLWLLLLSPLQRHLLLLAPLLDPEIYYVVGFVRRYAMTLLAFAIGYRLSDRATAWIERRWPNLGEQIRRFTALFERFGPL